MTHLKAPFKVLTQGALVAIIGVGALHPARAAQDFELRTASSRPDAVSGSDVLIEATAPAAARWSVMLDGRDVTPSFHTGAAAAHSLALLTGLKPGKHTLEMRVNGAVKSKLAIVVHSLSGPIFSGPHQQPFVCQTIDNGLGAAMDEDCSANTVVQYYYKSTEAPSSGAPPETPSTGKPGGPPPGFKPYDSAKARPSDVAELVTAAGHSVPYIVRREIGTINRAVYDIRFLHQPGERLPTPWLGPNPGWNGRLVYLFPGGWGSAYRQGTFWGVDKDAEPLIAQGYAVATSTLNAFGNESNDRINAETLSMVKEHFIEQFGPPVHVIGWGGSGGAMEQNLIAQNYPGLLDGIVVSQSFPDALTAIPTQTDCQLLDHAFKASSQPWTDVQKTAVSGFSTWRTCADSWGMEPPILDPRNCPSVLPKAAVYDPLSNSTGTRCDLFENQINIVGRDPKTQIAHRAVDNVGLQYGLVAFNRGQIDAEQFVDLNERAGGFDSDGNLVGARMDSGAESVRLAYQRGLVLNGGGALSELPIIDWRFYADDLGNQHDLQRSLIVRARLIAANGHAKNQVIRTYPRADTLWAYLDPHPDTSRRVQVLRELIHQMDRWLNAIAADRADGTLAAKVVRNKPADLSDGCVGADGENIVEPVSYDASSRCNQLYPLHANTRIAAGAPLKDDVLKCAVKPVNSADYAKPLSPAQLARLKAVFPAGVCDYSRPGIGQQAPSSAWQKF